MTRPRLSFASVGTAPSPSTRVAAGLATLNGAAAELRRIVVDHQARVRAIFGAVAADPALTMEGRQAAVRDRSASVSEESMAALGQLRDRVTSAQQAIDAAVSASWPKPAGGVEGLLGRQAAWARVRQLLDAGMKVSAVIAETEDIEALYALRDELPTWLRVRGATSETTQQAVQRVDAQIARVAGGTSEVDLMAKFEAQVIVAALEPLLAGAEAEMTGRVAFGDGYGLNAAIASAIAGQVRDSFFRPIVNANGDVV